MVENGSLRRTHGKSKNNKLYWVWSGIKQRCRNKNSSDWNDYGGRGISICDEWANDYNKFHVWATNNGYKLGLLIDRIDNDGNYEPKNCRWVNNIDSSKNKRVRKDSVYLEVFGENKLLRDWIKDDRCIIKSWSTLWYRYQLNWTPEEIITKPSRNRYKSK